MEKRLVVGRHDRLLEIVEKHLDPAPVYVSNHPNTVPAVGPGRPLGPRLGDADTRLPIDQKDAVCMLVGLLPQVNIVEAVGALISEEEAKIAMAVVPGR